MQRVNQDKDEFILQGEGYPGRKKYCSKCGLQLQEVMIYCPHCGTQCAVSIEESIQEDVKQDSLNQKKESWYGAPARSNESKRRQESSSHRYCSVCGSQLKEEAIYCSRCGSLCADDSDLHDGNDNDEGTIKKPRGRLGRLVLILITTLVLIALIVVAIFIIRNRFKGEGRNREEVESTALEQLPEESTSLQVTPTPLGTAQSWATESYTPPLASPEPSEAPMVTPGPFTVIQEGEYQLYTSDQDRALSIDTSKDGTIWPGWAKKGEGEAFQILGVAGIGTYRIVGSAGILGVSQNGEELQLAQANGQWSFASASGQGYYICLSDYPGYVLGYSRGTPAIEAYDPDSTTQQWILAQGQPMALGGGTDIEQWLVEFIPTLDDSYITEEEIYGLNQETMGYIRNGIYALSGKIFETKAYQDFFSSQPWYVPYSQDGDIVKKRFNSYQNHNLTICLEYERKMGWR